MATDRSAIDSPFLELFWPLRLLLSGELVGRPDGRRADPWR